MSYLMTPPNDHAACRTPDRFGNLDPCDLCLEQAEREEMEYMPSADDDRERDERALEDR